MPPMQLPMQGGDHLGGLDDRETRKKKKEKGG